MDSEKIEVSPKTVLVIDLNETYTDRKSDDPLEDITKGETKPDLYTIVRLLKNAATDSMIKGIYLKLNGNGNGFASSEELSASLRDFKSSGKFIYAFGDYIDQRAYFTSINADKIYCHPQGVMQWQGMSVEYVFFKSLIDKLEIKPQIFYAGKFKSATEPFRETAMTEANREQTGVWLNDLYDEMIQIIGRERKLSEDSLRAWASEFRISDPKTAVELKLIDGLRYDDEVKDEIKKKLTIASDEKISFMSIAKYAKAVELGGKYAADKIAVVAAEGEIVYGKSSPDEIGSDEFLSLLRKIRNDKTVKAVVIRVNSPGGSSLASEIIWREIGLIKKAGKKVVVSMGNVAASGGYYISCNADKIFVKPGTITGSIGVFSVIPDFSSFMKNKLGVTFDRVKTGEMADAPSVTRPMSDAEKVIVQKEVDRIYSTFKDRVAEGRKLKLEYVDSIAQGRVWTGKRALKLGLADAEGGLDEAIREAVKLSGLKEYKLKIYPEPKSILEYITEQYPGDLVSAKVENELGKDGYHLYKKIKELSNSKGDIKTMLPFTFTLH